MSSGRNVPNWITAYLAYTAESESPEEYHRWTAINVIAGALQRRVWFPMGYFTHYPNQYIVLVGPAGRCKKSTAMRIGQGMLALIPGVKFTVDSTTRERLILDLSQSFVDGHSSMTGYSSEFGSFVTSSGMDMVLFLTDIYDSPREWSHKTKAGGTNTIKAPCYNMMAATTPEWMAKAMPLDTVGIGLTSRIVFIYEDTPRVRSSRPQLSDAQIKLRELLAEDLQRIATLSGEYTWTEETFQFYDEWYQERLANPNPTGDPRLNGYFERKPGHVLKLAMVLAAAQRDELVLEQRDIELALDTLRDAEIKMPKAFANVGKNILSPDVDAVLEAVMRKGAEGAELGVLAMQFKHSLRYSELREITDTLVVGGMIQMSGIPPKLYYTGR